MGTAFLIYLLIVLSKITIPFVIWSLFESVKWLISLIIAMHTEEDKDAKLAGERWDVTKRAIIVTSIIAVLTPTISEWAAIITIGSLSSVDGITNIPAEMVDLSSEYMKSLKEDIINNKPGTK